VDAFRNGVRDNGETQNRERLRDGEIVSVIPRGDIPDDSLFPWGTFEVPEDLECTGCSGEMAMAASRLSRCVCPRL